VSNHLAVATVTATLKRTLDEALAAATPGSVPNASASTVRPEDASNGNGGKTGINIYLYQVVPNASLRNDELPTRRSDGSLARRPQAALDLYYLLTFYGDEKEQEPQRLLGTAVSTLNARPVLSRDSIRDAIDQAVADDPSTYLQFSDLVDQIDLVKLSPLPLNLEELSKLWSVFFQTPYVLSVAYMGTVVLIESDLSPRSALPVKARNLYVTPFRSPVVERVVAAAGPSEPITPGTAILVQGTGLRADVTEVRVGGSVVVPAADEITDTEIALSLPTGVPAGIQGVQVVQPFLMGTPPLPHEGVESNAAPFVLRPVITGAVTTAAGSDPGVFDVSIPLDPPVGQAQRVVLLLSEFGAPTTRAPFGYSFPAPSRNQPASPPTTATITVPTIGVQPGDYLVRVQVDGAESLLGVDGAGLFASPLVTFT
jgi:Pvc16 N-terminal domain